MTLIFQLIITTYGSFQIDYIWNKKAEDFCLSRGKEFPFWEGISNSFSNLINLLNQPSLFLPLVTKGPICYKIPPAGMLGTPAGYP
jgi:hypothetical protein